MCFYKSNMFRPIALNIYMYILYFMWTERDPVGTPTVYVLPFSVSYYTSLMMAP
jgi:hypothetical protein